MGKTSGTMESESKLPKSSEIEDSYCQISMSDVDDTESSFSLNPVVRKSQKFLKKCFKADIVLESLLTSVLLENGDLLDIFESGIAKAAHLSEFGDVQTVLSAVTRWSVHLHSKSGHTKSQQSAWCHENGIKLRTLKSIDKHLYAYYTEVGFLLAEKETPLLNFQQNVSLVHEKMTRIMAQLWHENLCVYRGHKDAGYMRISSKTPVLIGKKSCIRLTNEPPMFALCFGDTSDGQSSVEAKIWISVEKDLATWVLSKYYNTTTTTKVIELYRLVPFTVENIGFELGALVLSEKLGERFELEHGCFVVVFYDRDLKELRIFCQKTLHDKVRSETEVELDRFRFELERKEMETSYPCQSSQLRLQIGAGLDCCGVAGFRICSVETLPSVYFENFAYRSVNSLDATEKFAFRVTGKTSKNPDSTIESDFNMNHLVLKEDVPKYVWSSVGDSNVKLFGTPDTISDEAVVVDSAVEVKLFLLKENINTNKLFTADPESSEQADARSIADIAVSRMLLEDGHRIGYEENNIALWAEDVISENKVRVKITFPNLPAARSGVHSLLKNRSICVENLQTLTKDLNKLQIIINKDLFDIIEQSLYAVLEKMIAEHDVESFERVSFSFRRPTDVKLLISIQIRENCLAAKVKEVLSGLLLPFEVSANVSDMKYLRSKTGERFLKFVTNLTHTYVLVQEFGRKVLVYGKSSGRHKAAAILRRQFSQDPAVLRWYSIDLGKVSLVPNAVKVWFQQHDSCTSKLKYKGLINQYCLLEDCAELWLETTFETFKNYSNEVMLKLEKMGCEESDDQMLKRNVTCSICFQSFEVPCVEYHVLSTCGHVYCKDCFAEMIKLSVKTHKLPIKCAHTDCDRRISVCELKYVCGLCENCEIVELVPHLLENFVSEYSAAFCRCKKSDCYGMGPVNESDQTMVCLWCRGRFCLRCDRKFHGNTTCDAAFNITEWLQEDPKNRKPCPNCGIAIEKFDGCNCVNCAWCKVYMCWHCVEFYDINMSRCQRHMTVCHSSS